MKIFFNYSDLNPKYQYSQITNANIANNFKIFDKVYTLNKSNIDKKFYDNYKTILQNLLF